MHSKLDVFSVGVDRLDQFIVSPGGVHVTHIIQEGHAERALYTSSSCGSEANNIRGRGAIGSLDLVIVSGASFQIRDLNVVEPLATLRDSRIRRARRSAIVAIELVRRVKPIRGIDDSYVVDKPVTVWVKLSALVP